MTVACPPRDAHQPPSAPQARQGAAPASAASRPAHDRTARRRVDPALRPALLAIACTRSARRGDEPPRGGSLRAGGRGRGDPGGSGVALAHFRRGKRHRAWASPTASLVLDRAASRPARLRSLPTPCERLHPPGARMACAHRASRACGGQRRALPGRIAPARHPACSRRLHPRAGRICDLGDPALRHAGGPVGGTQGAGGAGGRGGRRSLGTRRVTPALPWWGAPLPGPGRSGRLALPTEPNEEDARCRPT